MTRIENEIILDFNDVLLKPKRSTLNSRNEVDLLRTFKFNNGVEVSCVPIMSANMTSVTTPEMVKVLTNYSILSVLHKHYELEDYKQFFGNKFAIPSVGVSVADREKFKAIEDNMQPWFLCIDVANGYTPNMLKQVSYFKNKYPHLVIIAGNVCTSEGTLALALEGADIIKAGLGCLSSGTRVLMSDGSYKNIEDIKLHDWVINKNGDPVEVIGTQFSGYKKVRSLRSNSFHKETLVTPCHKFWVGDLSNISDKSFQSRSCSKMLDQPTKSGLSKYKWLPAEVFEAKGKYIPLLPKSIKLKLPDDICIDVMDFVECRRGFNEEFSLIENVKSSYKLGYIFGTFLGDGNSSVTKSRRLINDKSRRNTTATLDWFFGLQEKEIANKLKAFIQDVFGYSCKIVERNKNVTVVKCRSNPLARLFVEFGKFDKKHLPEKYMCLNKEYLKGILDGLVDSDGSYCKDGRIAFTNTSTKLVEQYSIIFYLVNGYFPSVQKKEPTAGNLLNCNIDNCKPAYVARNVLHPEWLQTIDYQINKINSIQDVELLVPTYDIQVNCDTHSFIADNMIVHNSGALCLTRRVTGVGYPQFSTILECADAAHGVDAHVISDGGCVYPGDVAKSFCGGADFTMLGGMLAGHDESGGNPVYDDGKLIGLMSYGMSSTHANNKYAGGLKSYRASEGREVTIPHKGPVENTLQEVLGGLRSTGTYIGARCIKDFPKCATFVRVNNQLNRSLEKYE